MRGKIKSARMDGDGWLLVSVEAMDGYVIDDVYLCAAFGACGFPVDDTPCVVFWPEGPSGDPLCLLAYAELPTIAQGESALFNSSGGVLKMSQSGAKINASQTKPFVIGSESGAGGLVKADALATATSTALDFATFKTAFQTALSGVAKSTTVKAE